MSTLQQLDGDSLRRQTQAAREYADRHGLILDDRSFRDLGVSAYKSKNLEAGELGLFIRAVEDGTIKRGSTLLLENLDRLSRARPMVALRALERILELGVVLVTLQDGRRFTKESLDDLGDLITSLVTIHRSHEESKVKGQRVQASWTARREAVAKGTLKLITRQCPAWLHYDENKSAFVLIPDRVRIVRRIFELLPHHGAQSIARKLNDDGVKSFGSSQAWSHPYVRKISRSVAVLGTLRLPNGEVVERYYPPAITPAQWHAAQRTPGGPKPPSGPSTFKNLFTGLTVCGLCGAPLHVISRGVRARKSKPKNWSDPNALRLECSARRARSGCTAKGWQYTVVEDFILGGIYSRLNWKNIAPSMKAQTTAQIEELEERVASLRQEHESVRQRKARLLSAIEQGGGDVAVLVSRLKELESREVAVARELHDSDERLAVEKAKLDTVSQDARKLADVFAEWVVRKSHTPSERQRMALALRESVESVKISEARIVVKLRRDGEVSLPWELRKVGRKIEVRMRERLKIK
jgi:hypothetical protein